VFPRKKAIVRQSAAANAVDADSDNAFRDAICCNNTIFLHDHPIFALVLRMAASHWSKSSLKGRYGHATKSTSPPRIEIGTLMSACEKYPEPSRPLVASSSIVNRIHLDTLRANLNHLL
jgi:hypothetical protein